MSVRPNDDVFTHLTCYIIDDNILYSEFGWSYLEQYFQRGSKKSK